MRTLPTPTHPAEAERQMIWWAAADSLYAVHQTVKDRLEIWDTSRITSALHQKVITSLEERKRKERMKQSGTIVTKRRKQVRLFWSSQRLTAAASIGCLIHNFR